MVVVVVGGGFVLVDNAINCVFSVLALMTVAIVVVSVSFDCL